MNMNASVSLGCTSTTQRCANAIVEAEPLTIDYYLDGDTLIIASASIPGRLYVTTSRDCTCPAGLQELPCTHAELRLRILRPLSEAPVMLTLDQADQLF